MVECADEPPAHGFIAALFLVLAWYGSYELSTGGALAAQYFPPSPGKQAFRASFSRALQQMPLPQWAYGAVWFVLFGLNAAAGYTYWLCGRAAESTFIATLVLYGVNILLNKAWTGIFFGAMAPYWALADNVLILLTAIAVWALFGVGGVWLSFGLFTPYVLWLFVANYLNWRFIRELRDIRAQGRAPPQRRLAKPRV